jgi:hypothetical protein
MKLPMIFQKRLAVAAAAARRFVYSMRAEWRAFRALYEGVLLAIVGAFEAGCCTQFLYRQQFSWVGAGCLAGSVLLMAYGLLDFRQAVRLGR